MGKAGAECYNTSEVKSMQKLFRWFVDSSGRGELIKTQACQYQFTSV